MTTRSFVAAEMAMLLGFARVLTGNSHDAWDLVQDTLLRMRIRWARIDRGGNPAAYARTTMARLNNDRLRRLRRELLTSSPGDSAPLLGVSARYTRPSPTTPAQEMGLAHLRPRRASPPGSGSR